MGAELTRNWLFLATFKMLNNSGAKTESFLNKHHESSVEISFVYFVFCTWQFVVTVGIPWMEFFACETPDQLRGSGGSDESRPSQWLSSKRVKCRPAFHFSPLCPVSVSSSEG